MTMLTKTQALGVIRRAYGPDMAELPMAPEMVMDPAAAGA